VFFLISKILAPLETPSDLLLLILVLGVFFFLFARLRRTGTVMVILAALAFLTVALFPVTAWLGAPLEDRFPRPQTLPEHVDGIIVLGGAIDPIVTEKRSIPSLNSAAERMTEFLRLARQYPEARLVFSGGSGRLSFNLPSFTEADAARLFFVQQGLDARRILFENKSRNTYENVIFTKALADPRRGQIWLLISSAQDMPRSVGIFRKAGWPVIAVPVAYKADKPNAFDLGDNLSQLDHAAHEWLGLLVYYIAGKTDALFPAPG
jgi:uncharacterized SAM-binding protein YcdF (DUF218 family)